MSRGFMSLARGVLVWVRAAVPARVPGCSCLRSRSHCPSAPTGTDSLRLIDLLVPFCYLPLNSQGTRPQLFLLLDSSSSPGVWGLCVLARATAAPPPACFLGGLKGPPRRIDFSINVRFGHGSSGGSGGGAEPQCPRCPALLRPFPLPSRLSLPEFPVGAQPPLPRGPGQHGSVGGPVGGSVGPGRGSVLT